ncbi:winged helix-turn-helix domain-containing protein [Methanoregula sp. UBA64]|jgi:predicted transcriptional regulator|uniref:winged helix-turn-helix domain-containing protein n=1 Tax=Methanoregula sp. UBA64 TaxID=1915554 RepID=UPI0025D5635B|nr:winged helix-turn-helix domain-containing protein [Methanoregula sp. UBA64]
MYDLVSFVGRGRVRKKVLQALAKPNSPTDLAKQLDIERSTISRAIIELTEKGLVECLTPDERMGRYYRITDVGKKVVNIIEGKEE